MVYVTNKITFEPLTEQHEENIYVDVSETKKY